MLPDDNPMILAVSVIATIVFVVLSTAADIACAVLDPRVRSATTA